MKKITLNFKTIWLLAILLSTAPAPGMMVKNCKKSFTRPTVQIIHPPREHDNSQRIVLELHNNIGKFQKLLKHEKLIRTVLSKYTGLGTIRVIADDHNGASYARYSTDKSKYPDSYIGLAQNWFERENEDEKQFAVAHEAAHIACQHWKNKSPIQRLTFKYPNLFINSLWGLAGLTGLGAGLCLSYAALVFHMELYTDYYIPSETFLYVEKCFAPIWISGIAGLSALYGSLKSSRQIEQQADLMAAEKLQTAKGGIKYFEKVKGCSFTHPSNKKRVAYLKQWQNTHDTNSAATVAPERE